MSLAVLKVFIFAVAFTTVVGLPAENKSQNEQTPKPRGYSLPNQRSGRFLKDWMKANKEGNPEEQGEYFEGDIVVPETEARNGVISTSAMWKDAKVPYEIVGAFSKYHR